MNKTKIEWVRNPDGSQGFTCNSKTGCLNHTPKGLCLGGLFPCYAFRLAHGRLRERYLANWNVSPPALIPYGMWYTAPSHNPFYPRWWPDRLEQIRSHKKPAGIFLDDMSDWMGDYWPEEWTEMELQVMRDCPQHRFYTLTKQPQNLLRWSPYPENCWLGVTVTSVDKFKEAYEGLDCSIATVHFISFEPLLSRMGDDAINLIGDSHYHWLDWLIIGAMTGTKVDLLQAANKIRGNNPPLDLALMPYKNRWTLQPSVESVEEIVGAADKAGIPVFLKNNLMPLMERVSPLVAENLRQEVPDRGSFLSSYAEGVER